ncbi:hypothetical protein [Streptomyces sp. 351MFTsu5.1]|uniref:hypothetical protein n=1 Tax=Streptomyces sp. 351MFTsu5.1 TaxID=1172180 RepID=UPI00037FB80E|nr:hypothetical protein [Streptomyces sp. 351MFTsu5.1]
MTAPHARSGDGLRVLRAAVFAAVCVVLAAAGHSLASCATVPWWTLGAGFAGAVVVVAPLAGRERSLPGIATLLALGQTVLHVLFGLGQHGTTAMAMSSKTAMAMSSMPRTSDAALVQQAARLLCGTTAAAISPAQAHRLLVEARLYPATGTGAGAGAGAVTGAGGAHAMTEASGSAGSSALSLLPSLPMLLGHVLAAVAAGWLLRRGDLALLRLAELSTYSARSMADGALVRSLRAALTLVRALRAGLPGAPEAGPRAPLTASFTPPRPRARALQHTVIRRGPPTVSGLVLAA